MTAETTPENTTPRRANPPQFCAARAHAGCGGPPNDTLDGTLGSSRANAPTVDNRARYRPMPEMPIVPRRPDLAADCIVHVHTRFGASLARLFAPNTKILGGKREPRVIPLAPIFAPH